MPRFDDINAQYRPTPVLACIRCDSTDGVQMEDSRTMYHFEGELDSPEDPNKPIPLCRPCAADHHAYWNERWDDYRSGQGV
jgi:hypothetical protein